MSNLDLMDDISGSNNEEQSVEEQNTSMNEEYDDSGDPIKETAFDPKVKRAYLRLLNRGLIERIKNKEDFGYLENNKEVIGLHLSMMNLKLKIDDKRGIVFYCEQEVDEEEKTKFPSLISPQTLSLYESLVLLVIRRMYRDKEVSGESYMEFEVEDVISGIHPFVPLINNDQLELSKVNGALKKLSQKRLINNVKSSQTTYEISPIIYYVIDADFLAALYTQYKNLAVERKEDGEQ